MIILGTQSQRFKEWHSRQTEGRNNGSYWYSSEIEEIILPKISADVFVVTAGAVLYQRHEVPDGAVMVCHDNRTTNNSYGKFFGKNILWVCSKHSTVKTLEEYGEKAVYIPLSIDTTYVAQYQKKRHTKDIAFVGNSWGFKKRYLDSLPKDIAQISDLEREDLLKEMSKYKRVICEGRVYLEATVLGCQPEIPKYEDTTAEVPEMFDGRPLDSRNAIPLWQEVLKERSENGKCIIETIRPFNDQQESIMRRIGEVFTVDRARAKELLSNEYNIVKEYHGQ